MGLRVSDHALVQFLERVGNMKVEVLREHLEGSFARAHAAARAMGDNDYVLKADDMVYVVRGDTVTAVLSDDNKPHARARALGQQGDRQ